MSVHVILLSAFLLNLAVITYQDITYRSVPLYVFVFAALLAYLIQYEQCGIDELFIKQIVLNAGFIAFNVLALFVYTKKIKKIALSHVIGLGDLAFYLVLIPLLSTPVYVYFHLVSLLIILLSYPLLKNVLALDTRAIPLAGLQALCLFVLIIIFEYCMLNHPITGTCSIIYWI